MALVRYPIGLSFSKCSCISASCAACLSHPKTSVCTAWSTRSPAHNGWPDTRSLRLPSVCCPQPGTPPTAHVCNVCVTRGLACSTKFTSWDTRNHGRNACLTLTRKPLPALREVPAALPAMGGQTPAAYGCPVCAALSLVRHPQPMSAMRASPAAGPATCAAPAATVRTSAPASCDCSVCTCSQCLHCVTYPQLLPATCATPATTGLQRVNTRAWSATCLRHQPWRGCIASWHFGEDELLLAVHLHVEVPNSMGCVTIVSLHTRNCITAWSASCPRHQPWRGCIASGQFGKAKLLLAVHLHAEVPNSMGCVTIVSLHTGNCFTAAAGPDTPLSLYYLRFGTFALLRCAHLGVTFSFCAKF